VYEETRHLGQEPAIEAMPLVAVAPVVLLVERVQLCVAQGKGVALVVVVRLVEGESVVHIELEVRVEHALQADGNSVVTGLGAALDGPQGADVKRSPKRNRMGNRPERVPEPQVVTVDEPRQVVAGCVGIANGSR